MAPLSSMSNLTRKFDFLQDRAQRRPIREGPMELSGGDTAKKTSIGHLKEFYLQRLAKTEPSAAARLGGGQKDLEATKPQATAGLSRPTFGGNCATKDIEDLEIMCNNCFNLIQSSEASSCTGDPSGCPIACRSGGVGATEKPAGTIGLLDLKLKKLRGALEARLTDSSSKVNVMRHLTQLRYHIDTATKWIPGCTEIGALSDHTVQQVKQLTATSRVLAPAVYIFSKRIENVVVQKERELRKAMVETSSAKNGLACCDSSAAFNDHDDGAASSVADLNSIVSELDSDCGTQYAETVVTHDNPASDVGNVQDANDYLSLKNEDEQRRWFYSQCLTVKLSCADKTRARKTLISDLYAKVRAEGVPIEGWVQWIRSQLNPEDTAPASGQASAASPEPESQPGLATASSGLSGASARPIPSDRGLAAASAKPTLSERGLFVGSTKATPSERGLLGANAKATPPLARSDDLERTVPVPAPSHERFQFQASSTLGSSGLGGGSSGMASLLSRARKTEDVDKAANPSSQLSSLGSGLSPGARSASGTSAMSSVGRSQTTTATNYVPGGARTQIGQSYLRKPT